MTVKQHIRQDTQIRKSDNYHDNYTLDSTLQSSADSLEYDLNAIRSSLRAIIGSSHWYTNPPTNLNSLNSSTLTPESHEDLDTLVHDISENSFISITRSANKLTNLTFWTDSGMTIKIRDFSVNRSAGRVSQITAVQYDGSGLALVTLTQNITRDSSGRVTSMSLTEV